MWVYVYSAVNAINDQENSSSLWELGYNLIERARSPVYLHKNIADGVVTVLDKTSIAYKII